MQSSESNGETPLSFLKTSHGMPSEGFAHAAYPEEKKKQESLPGHDYIRLEEVAAATPSGVGGRAGEPKSENHTDYFTETENKTITNTENRAADFTVIENKRFVAAILRCGCRKFVLVNKYFRTFLSVSVSELFPQFQNFSPISIPNNELCL